MECEDSENVQTVTFKVELWAESSQDNPYLFIGTGPMIPGAIHDDVIKWKDFPRYWPFVWGIHRSPANPPHKGQWRGALVFSLNCTRINGWVKPSWEWRFETLSCSSWRHCNVWYAFKQPQTLINWFIDIWSSKQNAKFCRINFLYSLTHKKCSIYLYHNYTEISHLHSVNKPG